MITELQFFDCGLIDLRNEFDKGIASDVSVCKLERL